MKNASEVWLFGDFALAADQRVLRRGGVPVALGARCLDVLILLVAEAGRLVTKDRFLAEVWRGTPVTDEALTQAIKTLRRELGDDAGMPRFIETVPRHGYRFTASVRRERSAVSAPTGAPSSWRRVLAEGGAGTLGATVAGVVGGIVFGAVGASQNPGGSAGASIFLVLCWLTIVTAMVGGAGVSIGIATAGLARSPVWRVAGGAIGGLVVGAVVKVVGLDAFHLLLGRSPGGIAGGGEGLLLGMGVGLGSWGAAARTGAMSWQLGRVALCGAAGGIAVAAIGGRLMAGSLGALAQAFPASRLGITPFAALSIGGEGWVAGLAVAGLEGALFATGIVGALILHACRTGQT
ncbi:winged helix-turn-helix domain-containing protein [Sphingomonas rubra]|uniref:DNA-binding winged helix-turn-helix (WHTH) domain-containing protein n=1 Tax=Sphingomonas rubra TaxID=634430 RepID=A0A1I5RBT6_9SPHN|nr:transcriptional regulator [Sphingomonas rubra]SFP55807.1 DNA-binding winged helix-turn-helix (wHTH) domain-containing protein [Sphingomonas rubra]